MCVDNYNQLEKKTQPSIEEFVGNVVGRQEEKDQKKQTNFGGVLGGVKTFF